MWRSILCGLLLAGFVVGCDNPGRNNNPGGPSGTTNSPGGPAEKTVPPGGGPGPGTNPQTK